MAKQKFTKEQKKQYFAGLRDQWTEAKKLLTEEKIEFVDALIRTHGLKCSRMSFFFTYLSMQDLGLDGVPYIDAKTFQGWRDNGFMVRKGEKSKLSGITWIRPGEDKADVESADFMFPKKYRLFHRSQVDAA